MIALFKPQYKNRKKSQQRETNPGVGPGEKPL